MTEDEWLTTDHFESCLSYVKAHAPSRKLQLLACAACSRVRHLFQKPEIDGAFESAYRWADGLIKRTELYRARELAGWNNRRRILFTDLTGLEVAEAALDLATRPRKDAYPRAVVFALHAAELLGLGPKRPEGFNWWINRDLAIAVRDIFGNPFRPVAFDPAWRTDTAVTLARGMYDSRDFTAMPILADALQDAGCEDEQVLNHCRDTTAPHVRGCWVCDLVLSLG